MAGNADKIVRRPPRALVLREERPYHGDLIGKKKLSPQAVEKKLVPHMDRIANGDQPLTQADADQVAHYLGRIANKHRAQ